MTSLALEYSGKSPEALDALAGMALAQLSLNLASCNSSLTDGCVERLQGLLLSALSLSMSRNLTPQGLQHLRVLPLTSLDLGYCGKLVDPSMLLHVGLPLTSLSLTGCRLIGDYGLAHLQGLPLTALDTRLCSVQFGGITAKGLSFFTCRLPVWPSIT